MSTPEPDGGSDGKQGRIEGKPVRRRSPVERIIVWGGILVLFGVVLVEWVSRDGFTTSLKNLEEAVHRSDDDRSPKEISPGDAEKMIRGYAIRGEENIGQKKVITFRWPSVFKTYKIALLTNDSGQIVMVESDLPNAEAK